MSVTVSESINQLIFSQGWKKQSSFQCKLTMGGRQMAENQATRRSPWYKNRGLTTHFNSTSMVSSSHFFIKIDVYVQEFELISPLALQITSLPFFTLSHGIKYQALFQFTNRMLGPNY